MRLVWDAAIYLDAALPLESAPAMVGATFESVISASLRAATPERDRIASLAERYVRGDIDVDEAERLVHEALR